MGLAAGQKGLADPTSLAGYYPHVGEAVSNTLFEGLQKGGAMKRRSVMSHSVDGAATLTNVFEWAIQR